MKNQIRLHEAAQQFYIGGKYKKMLPQFIEQ